MQNYRDNIMQYRANRQMAPCCEKKDALEGMPLAMAYVHGRCGENFMMQKKGSPVERFSRN